MAFGRASREARREFEWQLTLGDNSSYSQIEVKLTCSAYDTSTQPELDRVMAYAKAADFLHSLAEEISHMAKGINTND